MDSSETCVFYTFVLDQYKIAFFNKNIQLHNRVKKSDQTN